METNLHTKEIFEGAYGNRSWDFYKSLLSKAVLYGMPGVWLDVGAGTGLFTECANRFGIRCIGLEGSTYGVNTARERYPDMEMRLQLLDKRLPYDDNSVATIVCNQVIEHLAPQTANFMLKECFRVLQKSGVILIFSDCRLVKKHRLEKTHINLYTPTELHQEVERIGFSIICSPNSPRLFFGKSSFSRLLSLLIFKITPLDILSSSVNCIAKK